MRRDLGAGQPPKGVSSRPFLEFGVISTFPRVGVEVPHYEVGKLVAFVISGNSPSVAAIVAISAGWTFAAGEEYTPVMRGPLDSLCFGKMSTEQILSSGGRTGIFLISSASRLKCMRMITPPPVLSVQQLFACAVYPGICSFSASEMAR